MKKIPTWAQNGIRVMEDAGPRAYSRRALSRFLEDNWEKLDGPESLNPKKVIQQLLEVAELTEVGVQPIPSAVNRENEPYQERTVYTWGSPSPYSVAIALRNNSYFSHASAIFLHGLTDELPKTIYVNKEQSPKPKTSLASQEALDRAFAGKPRLSKYIFEYEGNRISLLNGKNTGNLEVTELEQPNGEFYPVTKIERTLIDSIVRPAYAGGIHHVREAFAAAKDRVSINVFVATLQMLDYVYPYHQALGFILERVGVSPEKLDRLRESGLKYDFYLTYGMKETEFDPSWRIHYPRGF